MTKKLIPNSNSSTRCSYQKITTRRLARIVALLVVLYDPVIRLANGFTQNFDRIFLNIPVEFDTVKIDSYINHAIRAVVEADAELLVVNTGSYVPPNQPTDALAIEIRRGLIERVKQSGLAWIAVEPIVYLENFLIPGLLNEGVLAYPVPTDQPISWISLDDAAQYHAYALIHPELAGNILAAPGKESLTGEELAQTFGSVLEQKIKFVSLPFDHFEAAISPLLDVQNAAGLKGLYQWISGHTAILPIYEEVAPDVKKDMELTSAEEWASQTLR